MCKSQDPPQFFNHHRDINQVEHREWFTTSDTLFQARQEKPHLVFLEGPPGSGKKEVLGRLSKLGYVTGKVDFFDLLRQTNGDLEAAEQKAEEKLQQFVQSHSTSPCKENLMFFNRSPLSQSDLFQRPQAARDAMAKVFHSRASLILVFLTVECTFCRSTRIIL